MRNEPERFIPLGDIPREPPEQDIQDIDELSSRIKDLEKVVGDVEKSATKVEKRITFTSNFISFIVGALAVGFVLAAIPIALDYFRNNEERYEKFISKTEEVKEGFYTKEELRLPLDNVRTNTKILNCLRSKGLFSPQCFD